LASGEITSQKFKNELHLVEDIPVGGGIDALSAPTKLQVGMQASLKNLLLDKHGAYMARNPFTTLDVEDNNGGARAFYQTPGPVNHNVTENTGGGGFARFVIPTLAIAGGAVDNHVRVTHLFHYQRNDKKQCYILIADNNSPDTGVAGDDYICAVFKVNIDGTNPMNITPPQSAPVGPPVNPEADMRLFTCTAVSGANPTDRNGCRRDIYWDCTVYTDLQSGYDILVLTNGATVPLVWAPDDPELANPIDYYGPGAGVYQECATYMGYPSSALLGAGQTAGDWERPYIIDTWAGDAFVIPPTVAIGGTGYLQGKYLYKCLWMCQAAGVGDGTQHRSPASMAFPSTTAGYTDDGIICNLEYVQLGNAAGPGIAGQLPLDVANAHLEIYRTKGDGKTFYHLVTLPPNTPYYEDRIPDRDLGWEIPNLGDPPPAGFRFCENYGARIWLANRRITTAGALQASSGGQYANQIIYSDIGYPFSFRTDYSDLRVIHEAKTKKNDPITALYSREDFLVIGCEDSIFIAQGYDPAGYARFDISCIDRNRGISSHRTIVEDNDGNVYWLWQKEILKFDLYKIRRVARMSERILNKIDIQQIPTTHTNQLERCCAVFYPHKNYMMLAYTSGDAALPADFPNKLCAYYPEIQQFIEFEVRNSAGAGNSFTAMAEAENDDYDFERIILGESAVAIGGYIYRWDRPQLGGTGSADNWDIPGGTPASRQTIIQKDWITDWLNQHKPFVRKQYNYLYLLCKTRIDSDYGAADNTRSKLQIAACLDGQENWSSPAYPTTPVVENVWVDKANFNYFEVMVDLASEGNQLIGQMIKLRIKHIEQGIPLEIVDAKLLYNEFQRHDETKYSLTP